MKLRRLALLLIAVFLPTGCGKTFSGPDLNGKVKMIEISGTLENIEGASTILRVRLSLDGNEISSIPLTEAASRIGIGGAKAGDRGHHTLVLVVSEQTSSPNNYRISGLRVSLIDAGLLGSGPTLAQTTMPDRTQLLGSGDVVTYQFDLL